MSSFAPYQQKRPMKAPGQNYQTNLPGGQPAPTIAGGAPSPTPMTAPKQAAPQPIPGVQPTVQQNTPNVTPGFQDLDPATGPYAAGQAALGKLGDEAAAKDAADKQAEHDASFQGQADSLWADMMANYEGSLGGKMQQTYADEANAGRRMAEMNAGLGRGVSGGFAGGAAQVSLGGMQQRQDVMNQHTQQGLTMKAAYLDRLIKQAEASNDRELQQQLEAERNATQLAIAGAGIDTTQYSDQIDPEAYNTDSDMDGMSDGEEGETIVKGLDEMNSNQVEGQAPEGAQYHRISGKWYDPEHPEVLYSEPPPGMQAVMNQAATGGGFMGSFRRKVGS